MIILILLIICIVKRRKNIAAFRLDGEGSIDFSGYIELGGIKQYVSVRGENDRNPILLFLHGGPGAPVSCVSYCYQRPLERSLTVVNWDQRGSGRTYYENADCSGITIDTLVTDLEEFMRAQACVVFLQLVNAIGILIDFITKTFYCIIEIVEFSI